MFAFEGPALDQAKVGVLSASARAAVVGYLLLRASPAPEAQPERVPVTT